MSSIFYSMALNRLLYFSNLVPQTQTILIPKYTIASKCKIWRYRALKNLECSCFLTFTNCVVALYWWVFGIEVVASHLVVYCLQYWYPQIQLWDWWEFSFEFETRDLPLLMVFSIVFVVVYSCWDASINKIVDLTWAPSIRFSIRVQILYAQPHPSTTRTLYTIWALLRIIVNLQQHFGALQKCMC